MRKTKKTRNFVSVGPNNIKKGYWGPLRRTE